MSTYYEVTLRGSWLGNDIIDVLWYRATTLWDTIGDWLGAGDALAAEVKQNIWQGSETSDGAYRLRQLVNAQYTLNSIDVKGYDATFNLFSATPIVHLVGEVGSHGGDETNGPAQCVIMKANLEPAFGPGINLPKKGYLAFGPIADPMVGNDGHITSTWLPRWQALGDACASNIVTELPVETFYPIRVRVTRALGVVTSITYRDVSAFVVRPLTSFRRSRLPEV